MSDEIHIRPAHPGDADWIAVLAPRLHEFGPPPWREVDDMNVAVIAGNLHELTHPSPGTAFFVAEDSTGAPLGFVTTRTDRDYFLDIPVGHVVDIVVAKSGEGRGVGRALLEAAERWAEGKGYPWMTLNVFAGNDRARRLYEHVGYVPEWTKMLKSIGPRRDSRKTSDPVDGKRS